MEEESQAAPRKARGLPSRRTRGRQDPRGQDKIPDLDEIEWTISPSKQAPTGQRPLGGDVTERRGRRAQPILPPKVPSYNAFQLNPSTTDATLSTVPLRPPPALHVPSPSRSEQGPPNSNNNDNQNVRAKRAVESKLDLFWDSPSANAESNDKSLCHGRRQNMAEDQG
jgi:hypothetical protein